MCPRSCPPTPSNGAREPKHHGNNNPRVGGSSASSGMQEQAANGPVLLSRTPAGVVLGYTGCTRSRSVCGGSRAGLAASGTTLLALTALVRSRARPFLEYLQRYVEAYRAEWARFTQAPPAGAGYPALRVSPYLAAG